MTEPNLYDVLGVDKSASPDEIKDAYRRRAKEAHPDAGGTEEKFQDVSRAYMVLSRPDRRQQYDRAGTVNDEADNSNHEALTLIHSLLEQAITQAVDNPTIDVVTVMRLSLEKRIHEIEPEIASLKQLNKKLNKFALRFKTKTKKSGNLLRHMVMVKVRANEGTISSGGDAIRNIKQALKIMESYSFEVDEVTPSVSIRITPGMFAAFGVTGSTI